MACLMGLGPGTAPCPHLPMPPSWPAGAGPSWGQEVIEALCAHVPCPLIFPLSNPTDKAEITAEQAYK